MSFVCIGYKIIVFADSCNSNLYKPKTKMLLVYDVLCNRLSWKENKFTNNKRVSCCTKVPVV